MPRSIAIAQIFAVMDLAARAEKRQVHRHTPQRFYKCCSHRPVAGPFAQFVSTLPKTAHRAVATADALC